MEEQKNNKTAKTVAMNTKEAKGAPKKLSYEELNNYCMEVFQENQRLMQQLKQLYTANAYKRLDYLFKVLEFAPVIKDADFINSCIEEIKDAIAIPDNASDKEE